MSEKIIVGPVTKGLRNDVTPFNIDNDAFPTLINAYQWRGRIKRKRGTEFLCRLERFLGTTSAGGALTVTILPIPIDSAKITVIIGTDIFVDPGGASPVILTTNGSGVAVLNRATGVLLITLAQPNQSVFYYPTLPVMGLEDFVTPGTQFPECLGFDTHYSYLIDTDYPYLSHDVSFYKNPPTATYPGYVQKTLANETPIWWNGQDYQQFWTVNYQGALFATNGINVPFNTTNIGMQFAGGSSSNVITFTAFTATTVTVSITNSPLVIGDFVFFNEWTATGGTAAQILANSATLNFQTGYVTAAAPNTLAPAVKVLTITFPNANITSVAAFTPGIIQYLTNRSDTSKDNIRWFDGDPTDGNPAVQNFVANFGWVNFMPPLSREPFPVGGLPPAQYYLVGARLIVAFKDRLLMLGPVVQSSTTGPFYLQDTIIYSQNGTPYYTASFTGDPSLVTTNFTPILVPANQVASPTAWWEDQTGFGGFITAGIDQPIVTCGANEDVLIIGFEKLQTRLIYSGNDIVPFNFFIVNSELGSASTFSAIVFDKGVQSQGARGYIMTSQTGAQRIDPDIPDQVFQINEQNNGNERVTSQRDFILEWVYTTYPSNQQTWRFPNQTLQYNYRDDSYAIMNETYTHYGQFRKHSGQTWATSPVSLTWNTWNDAWNSGKETLEAPLAIAGNQQGFVVFKDIKTDESVSLAIQNIVGNTITSPDHCLTNGNYIRISGVSGTVGAFVNGQIFSVYNVTQNDFQINPSIAAGTYLGNGYITRLYVPFIQTKQFPMAWGMSRKTRIGPQQYLLTRTSNAQITLLIFLSQDPMNPYNANGLILSQDILPNISPNNNSLIYSTILYTCPESQNLGLTPMNINLNTPTATTQQQIWHRMNTSLLGDTVQIGFTLSDTQMRAQDAAGSPVAITAITSGLETILATTAQFGIGTLVEVDGVVGMIQLNENFYEVLDSTPTTMTINVNSTGFSPYISGGTVTPVGPNNQFAEIEIHGMILEVNQSSLLS